MENSLTSKFLKSITISRDPVMRYALIKHHVAAATEHLEAIRFCNPATLIDIGANKGQFSIAVCALFPNVVIHAFEPLPSASARFEKVFASNSQVTLHRVAIGAEECVATFHVADREDSSSLLKPGKGQEQAYGVTGASTIEVPVRRLEQILDVAKLARPVMMKIDVQGAELEVLRGIAVLEAVDLIYVELSFVELYEGQALFENVQDNLAERGFKLRGVFNQSFTEAFGPTQADCLFVRKDS